MTVAFAPSPWPAPHRARDGAGTWRFGQEVDGALQWVLARNCSISPRQLAGVYLALCAVSATISLGFWWHGAPAVAAFAGIELLGLGAALLVFARHAGDRETITLDAHHLAVVHQCGGHVCRDSFRVEWVRVEPTAGDGSVVEVAGEGRTARVGRYLHASQRADLAHELRRALRGLRGGAWR
jgi:uncharacterized membrane protein